MNDDTSYQAAVLCFLAGAVTGAAGALLFAPQSGAVTREMMQRTLRNTTTSARDLRDQVVRRGEEVGEEAAHRLTTAAAALAGSPGALTAATAGASRARAGVVHPIPRSGRTRDRLARQLQ